MGKLIITKKYFHKVLSIILFSPPSKCSRNLFLMGILLF